jgi:hypothetical protein
MSGGGGGPSSTTVTQSNVPDWLRPQVETAIGAATKELFTTKPGEGGTEEITGVKPFTPYSQSPEDYVAGFSPLQQQAFGGAANLRLPGQFGAASYGTQGAAFGAAGAGDRYMGMATNPFATQAFMSPYMQNVVDVQQQQAQRQADIANQAMNAKFAQQGAFGGARQGLAGAQANAELMRQKQNIQATGLQNAFQQAQQAQQFGANLGLQGLNTALAGFGQLGNLGTQQLAAQRGIIDTQNQMGAIQQQREQNIINQAIQNFAQARENPMLRLNQFNALLRGYAQPGTTTTQYQAAPPMANQLASLGMGAYGASKMFSAAKGGAVKEPQRMATGGLPAINRKVLFDPDSVSLEQVQQGVKNETLSDLIGVPVALQKQKAQQSAISVPDQSPNMMAQAMQPAGIAGLPSNTSVPMAKGGIVAFSGTDEEGSLVSSDGASIADLLAERLGESPGQPKVYSALASMYPSLIKNIFEFTPKDMTPKEAAEYRAQYIKEAKEAGGPSPYEAYRKQLDELTGKRDTEMEKGAAWLQAAGALVQPGTTSFMQGLGQAGSTLGQKYAQIAKADTDAKRARAQMEFNLLDAERKERMGLHRDATASVAQARKDRIALNTSELNKRRAVADLVGKGMTATKPTSAGRPPSRMNIQQANVDATEAFLKNPTPANKARMEAMGRLLDQSRVSEIGPNRFASTLTGPQVRTDVEVNETTKQILMGIVEHPLSKDYSKAVKAGDADAASGIEARIRESVRAGFTPMPKPTGTPKPTPGAPSSYKVGEERPIQSGEHAGKTAVWDGNGWKLKE